MIRSNLKPVSCRSLWIVRLSLFLGLVAPSQAQTSLGPIGGTFQHQDGSNYLKVESLVSGGPGALAGLQVGDFIYKGFGDVFSILSENTDDGWKGSVQEFGQAIERAESGNGALPLSVLRPGIGDVDLTLQLPAAGGFGPAYPLGSTKFDAMYQWACADIHSSVTASSNGDFGYNTGLFGLILLSHPNWNDTTGARPYRPSVDKLKDWCVSYLNARVVTPVEAINLDGTPNDGSASDSNTNDQSYVEAGLENWAVCTAAMYVGEYRQKTGDTSVDAAVQRAADMLAARVQDYQQPPEGSTTGPTRIGMMSHGGVVGDYAHIGWTGLNIINAQALPALVMLKNAGATINDDKFQKCWLYMKGATNQGGGTDDGNVGYAHWTQSGWDSAGRTAGAIFGMENYGGISPADQVVVDKQKAYLVRHWERMQHAHAYTVGGVYLYQFALPYLSDREQRYIMENLNFFYQFHRNAQGTLDYFGGRQNNGGDGYLNLNRVKLINVAMAQAIHSGNLPSFPAVNPARLHADFKAPVLTWPTVDARAGIIRASSADFNVDVTDYLGTVLNAGDYTASWTHLSGPGTATFTAPSAASTTVNFPLPGTYRIQLQVTRGGYTLTEPIDLEVIPFAPPPGYTVGHAEYRVYQNISGSTVAELTSHANYPDAPDITGTVDTLEGTHSGNDYGSRIQGFIIPQVSGSYTFYIASDDASEFRFGATEGAATKICEVVGFTAQYEWTNQSAQASTAQSLTAGTPYFFEANHKEGGGGDHVAVAWTGPGIATPAVISGNYLAQQDVGAAAIISQPTDQTAAAGGNATFTVQVSGQGPFLYEWTLDGVSYWPASSSSALALENISAGAAGAYQCNVTTPAGTLASTSATLTVTGVGTLTSGGLWREVYENIGGGSVSDLTGHQRYPTFPDSGGVIATTEAPANVGGNYGQRWTGWLKPDVTGAYTFYIASDDSSELWLSTNEQPVSKVRIAQLNGYTSEKNWSGGGQSAPIQLTAGSTYYIEVRHKEGGGDDHCAVTWRKPGDPAPTNGVGSIPTQYLEYLVGGTHSDTVAIDLALVQPAIGTVRIRPGVGLALEVSAFPAPVAGDLIAWTKQSGPGAVTFDSISNLVSGATFSDEGNYVLRCTVDNGGVPASVEVHVSVSSDMAASWSEVSIAEPTAGSGAVNPDGSVSVSGSGNDIYGLSDQCHLFYQDIAGDFDIRTRVVSKTITAGFGTHAQLQARESTAANSRNIALTHETVDRVAFQYRNSTGGTTTYQSIQNLNLPLWIRLVRSGGNPGTGAAGQTFTGYYSTDGGATWIQRETVTYGTAMPETLLVGLAVSSGGSSLNHAVFDNISGFSVFSNFGPEVDAGSNTTVGTLGNIPLVGSVVDDGLPSVPGSVTSTWSVFSGPGSATFGDASAPVTTVNLAGSGVYVLRLASTDGEVTTFDDVTVTAASDVDVSIAATDPAASEVGPDTGTFTVTRTGSTTNALIVNLTISGTASNGVDYSTIADTVEIPVGSASATITVTPLSDGIAEADESVEIAVAPGSYNAIPPGDTVTIASSNTAPVAGDATGSVSEAAIPGVYAGTVGVTDVDPGDSHTFAITAGNIGGAFSVDPGGAIRVAAPLDYETISTYVLTVEVTDLGGLSDIATVTITLVDLHDAPVAAPDALTVSATDGAMGLDVLINDTVDATATKTLLGIVTTPVSYDAGTSGAPPNPTAQGWTEIETEDGNIATGTVTGTPSVDDNGSGLDAWVVTDNTGANGAWLQYRQAPTTAQRTAGNARGWMLETQIRFIDDFGQGISTQIEYGDGTKRFLVFFDLDTSGDLTARLWGTGGGTYLLTHDGSGADLFRHVVVLYDPATARASFTVDGVRYDTGAWTGQGSSANGVEWGNESSGGRGSAAFHSIAWSYFYSPVGLPGGAIATTGGNQVTFDPNGGYAALAEGETAEETVRYALGDDTGFVTVGELVVTIEGTNDDDEDTLHDDWEVTHYGAVGNIAPGDDTDGDGDNAFQEMVFGTDPKTAGTNNAQLRLQIVDTAGTPAVEFRFRRPLNHADFNVTYQLQTGSDLAADDWADHPAVPTVIPDGMHEWVTYLLPPSVETPIVVRCHVTPL